MRAQKREPGPESWRGHGSPCGLVCVLLGAVGTLDWICPPLSQLSLGVTAQLVNHTGAWAPAWGVNYLGKRLARLGKLCNLQRPLWP